LPAPGRAWPDGIVIRLRVRSEWRRRWRALGALTLLVAVTGAVVLTAAAGSRRTRSSIDRADRITKSVDAYATIGDDPSLTKVGAITRLPEVAVGKRLALMGLFSAQGFAVAGSPVDPGWGKDLLGYRVLRGRAANPDQAEEIALSETTAAAMGLDVGGVFDLASPSTAQWRCLDGGARPVDSPLCKAILLALNRDRIDLSQLQGPQVHLHVVGITRSLFEVGAASNVVFFNLLTPAFFRKYRTAMQWQSTVMVRYRAGVTDEQFEAALHKTAPGDDAITDSGTFTSVSDALRSTAGVLANGLLVFAGVAALVGLVLISQVLARNADRGNADRAVLRVFGATRAERVIDACAPLVPVAVAGTLLAVLGAWVGSNWMPIGTARQAEFARGRDFDATILIGGAVVLVAVLLVTSAAAALWVGRTRASGASRRPGLATRFTIGGVTTTAATSMVTQVGHGRRAIPLRSAVAGTALAMAGVIGVAVFSGSLTRLTTEPARQGWGWDVIVRGFTSNDAIGRDAQGADRLAADPDLSAITQVWLGYLPRVNGHTVAGFGQRRLKGDRGFVIVNGRAPVAADEVALGAKTLQRVGTSIGRPVDVDGKSFHVVGTATFPGTTNNDALADGALFTDAGLRAAKLVAGGGENSEFGVSFRPGVDRKAATERLKALNNDDPPGGPVAHAEIEQLRQLDRLPWALAAFLVVIALLAVGHLIVLSVRRRGHDLAVLRALGCTPGQVDRIVALQATMLAIAGVVVGVPVGIFLGHVVWGRIADAYGVANDAALPWIAMGVAVAGTLVLVNAIAWWPARQVGRKPVAQALMTE
jgi:FtsX-like permease family